MISLSELKKLVRYDPSTGELIRLTGRRRGFVAGTTASTGYRHIFIKGKFYLGHRIVWFYMTGKFPPHQIDHINGIRDDNRFSNLRLATRGQNLAAGPVRKNNKSGLKGVHFHKNAQKWQAQIVCEKKHYYLGLWPTAEAAHQAYMTAAKKLHRDFAPKIVRG